MNKPTDEQVDAAVPRISSPEHELYFFSRLKNPHWIAPLRERGFFKSAPGLIEVESGVRCPVWPQSRYLAKMAPLAPQEVTDILVQIDTENWSVAADMLDAAKQLPPQCAAQLSVRIGGGGRERPTRLLSPFGYPVSEAECADGTCEPRGAAVGGAALARR